jgi:uncharacterized protein YndB with AHSA1/START domain
VSVESDVARASVDVALDVTTAFDVFTAEIGEWYVVDEHTVVDRTRTKSIRIEPWVGGRFLDVYDVETGEGVVYGTVIVWEPPHRLVFVDDRRLDVEVTFESIDGGCRVTVEERGLDNLGPDVAQHVRTHGWHRYLPEWFDVHVTGDTR